MTKLFDMVLRQDLDIEISQTDIGDILLSRNSGGSFAGDSLSGKVHPLGMTSTITSGETHNDVEGTFLLETEDEAKVVMEVKSYLETGSIAAEERVAAGETIDPDDYYFMGTACFHTNDEKCRWLERKLYICKSAIESYEMVKIAVYEA